MWDLEGKGSFITWQSPAKVSGGGGDHLTGLMHVAETVLIGSIQVRDADWGAVTADDCMGQGNDRGQEVFQER